MGSTSGGRGVAPGRPACQRATRALRCATALRVTHRPSLRSDSSYGPCGPAWTGRPGRSHVRAERSAGVRALACLPGLIGVFHHFQRGGEPLASDHDTTTAVGCHAVARRECTRRPGWPVAVWVRPSWRRSRCGACGRRAPRYDRRPRRRWLHVPWGRTPVWLQYAPWRVSCRQCGVRVERVSWAVGNSAFTAPLEELTAYLAQVTDRTTVSRVLGISWPAVG